MSTIVLEKLAITLANVSTLTSMLLAVGTKGTADVIVMNSRWNTWSLSVVQMPATACASIRALRSLSE